LTIESLMMRGPSTLLDTVATTTGSEPIGFACYSRMADSTRWHAADVVRLIGWGCICTAVVLVLPAIGEGGGASHEPGSDTIRTLLFERGYGLAAVVIALVGVLVLGVGKLVPDRT
jgi:hypothetical protein